MKKTLSVLSAVALVSTCGLALAGCGAQESHVGSAKDLASALQKGGEVVLDKDITLDQTITVSKKVRLNLNGKTLTENFDWDAKPEQEKNVITMIQVAAGGDLTVMGNGKVVSDDLYLFNVDGGTGEDESARLVIESGQFTSDLTAVQVNKGSAEIKGGTYKVSPENKTYGTKYLLNVIDENRATSKISVTGGTFYDFDVSKNNNGDGAYLAEGYKVTEGEGKVFVVSKA